MSEPAGTAPAGIGAKLVFGERLGQGGYGEVYQAQYTTRQGMESEVAVKLLNANIASGSDAERRLRDEARLLGALTHPGIVRVYDLVEVEGRVALIAEFVDGQDLDKVVAAGLPPRALVEVVGQVASALDAAWSRPSASTGKPLRLVHRDVKPENVRVTRSGAVKLLDFGVARAAAMRREARTATNVVMGSYRYMAPERFDAERAPTPAVDVYALGCILFEGLAGTRLFEELSLREVLMLSLPGSSRYEDHLASRLALLSDGTPGPIVTLLGELLQRDPAGRPSPGELAARCDDISDTVEGEELGAWCRARRWPRLGPVAAEMTGRVVALGVPRDEDTTVNARIPALPPVEEVTEADMLAPASDDDPTIKAKLPPGLVKAPKMLERDGPTLPDADADAEDEIPTDRKVPKELMLPPTPGPAPEREMGDTVDRGEEDIPTTKGVELAPAPAAVARVSRRRGSPSLDSGGSSGIVVANLAVLGLLVGVGLLIIVIWLLLL